MTSQVLDGYHALNIELYMLERIMELEEKVKKLETKTSEKRD